jgi:DNA-binding MarR family transcriptional regulator
MSLASAFSTPDESRILDELAHLAPMGLTKLDVAQQLDLPQRYATKLLNDLVEAGVLEARPGQNNRHNKTYYLPSWQRRRPMSEILALQYEQARRNMRRNDPINSALITLNDAAEHAQMALDHLEELPHKERNAIVADAEAKLRSAKTLIKAVEQSLI